MFCCKDLLGSDFRNTTCAIQISILLRFDHHSTCTVNPTQYPVLLRWVAYLVVGPSLYPSKVMTAAPYFCVTYLTCRWLTLSWVEPHGHGTRWNRAPPSRTYWTSPLDGSVALLCWTSRIYIDKYLLVCGRNGREDDLNTVA